MKCYNSIRPSPDALQPWNMYMRAQCSENFTEPQTETRQCTHDGTGENTIHGGSSSSQRRKGSHSHQVSAIAANLATSAGFRDETLGPPPPGRDGPRGGDGGGGGGCGGAEEEEAMEA